MGSLDWLSYIASDEHGVARERRQTRFEAWKTVSEQAVPIKQEIEKGFRVLLGHGKNLDRQPEFPKDTEKR